MKGYTVGILTVWVIIVTKASMLAEFFFALAIGSGMSCVP